MNKLNKEESIFQCIKERNIAFLTKWDWYIHMKPQFKEYFFDYDSNKEGKGEEWFFERNAYTRLIAEGLQEQTIILGNHGWNHDTGRLPVDSIIIHHTSTHPKDGQFIIEALVLIRLYAKYYMDQENEYYHQPIWSGHFYRGRQTFIPYHYLVWPDGKVDHILNDKQIGWQAGAGDYNRRSIAIAFVDELEEKPPTKKALMSTKNIVASYKSAIILGHKEVNIHTECPGKLFPLWKDTLL